MLQLPTVLTENPLTDTSSKHVCFLTDILYTVTTIPIRTAIESKHMTNIGTMLLLGMYSNWVFFSCTETKIYCKNMKYLSIMYTITSMIISSKPHQKNNNKQLYDQTIKKFYKIHWKSIFKAIVERFSSVNLKSSKSMEFDEKNFVIVVFSFLNFSYPIQGVQYVGGLMLRKYRV